MIGTDEQGDTWLIEAKLCSNPELNENIWREQLDPYRLSLSKRSEDEIVMGARRYLIKANANSVFPPFINDSVEGLYDGFKQWCAHWGFNGRGTAKVLNQRDLTEMSLKNGMEKCTVW